MRACLAASGITHQIDDFAAGRNGERRRCAAQSSLAIQIRQFKHRTWQYGLEKATAPVVKTRGIGKKDMVLNDAMPKLEIDPETFEVGCRESACWPARRANATPARDAKR